jgi:hypothetical protein
MIFFWMYPKNTPIPKSHLSSRSLQRKWNKNNVRSSWVRSHKNPYFWWWPPHFGWQTRYPTKKKRVR